MNTRTDNNEVIKRVIYKNKKPKMVIVRRIDAQYLPRVKSAPPISIPEPVPEKKHVLLKADGTPLTIEDLDDITDSSTSSSFEEQDVKELKDVEKEKAIESVEVKAVEVKDKESDMEKDMKQKEMIKPKELPTVKLTCDRCKYGLEERTEMLEELLKEFPPIIRKFIPIAEILSCKERASFDLKLMKKVKAKPVSRSTYVVDKNRKDTAVELARLELNKLTASNFNTVVSKLKALNIEKVDESKEIASILLDKATSEPTFVKLYAKVVGELKKVLRSKEELAMKIKQTAFFGTLLTKAFAIVNDKIEWADPKTVINLKDFPNRFAYEEKIEEMEEKRYKKKAKTVGAITFVSQLYIDNIISFGMIGDRIEQLLLDSHYESVEVLCAFLTAIGEKLQKSSKEHVVNKICSHLSAIKNNYEFRIQFLIEDTLEKSSKWKKAVSNTTTQNRFAFMEVEEVVPEVKKKEEITFVDDNSKVLSFISLIYSELNDCYEEEDKVVVADYFNRGIKEFGKQNFFNFFLSEAVSDFKKSKLLIPFFVEYFDRTGIDNKELVELLNNLKGSLKELKRDFPKSVPNYIELICLLKVKKIISNDQFENLKNEDFQVKSKEIITKWNKSEELKGFVFEVFEVFEPGLVNDILRK